MLHSPKSDLTRSAKVGRILGILASFLGILSVLSVLCFLFPDFLVSKDLRPVYASHLDLFRAILKGLIILNLSCGAISAVLHPSRIFGRLSVVLGLISLLMGGWNVEVISSGAPEIALGLDYFVLELLVLGLIFVPMERVWRLRNFRILRDGWQTDLTYFFVSHVGIQLFSFAALLPVQLALGWTRRFSFQESVAHSPLLLQILALFFISDFCAYWVHRLFHRSKTLWKFHAIHHSSRNLDWLAGSRFHFIDSIATRIPGFLPIYVFGFSSQAIFIYLLIVSFLGVYIHANVTHRFGPLKWLFSTPEFHHWHHAADPEALNKNFAVLLPVIDLIFGTAHLPGTFPREYGYTGEQPPEGFFRQFLFPFKRS